MTLTTTHILLECISEHDSDCELIWFISSLPIESRESRKHYVVDISCCTFDVTART